MSKFLSIVIITYSDAARFDGKSKNGTKIIVVFLELIVFEDK